MPAISLVCDTKALDTLAQPETVNALALAAVQIVEALSRPESTTALALTALVVLLVKRQQK